MLPELGFTYHGVKNGQEALEFLSSNPVDLIILDYSMPIMNGLRFLEERASIEALQAIPVFM